LVIGIIYFLFPFGMVHSNPLSLNESIGNVYLF
jgi:hypothetical protein